MEYEGMSIKDLWNEAGYEIEERTTMKEEVTTILKASMQEFTKTLATAMKNNQNGTTELSPHKSPRRKRRRPKTPQTDASSPGVPHFDLDSTKKASAKPKSKSKK